MSIDISSPSNERIKRLVRLRDRRHRDHESLFVVEGTRLVERAVEAGLTPVEVYTTEAAQPVPSRETYTVSREALDRASYRKRGPDILAVFEQFPLDLERLDGDRQSLVLVAEGIEKPGNLGAMLRTADAVGADAFVTIGEPVDPFNPNVIHASTGALFTVPFAQSNLDALLTWLKVPILVASPEALTKVWDLDLTSDLCLMVGSEAEGVSGEAKTAATTLVSLPMAGGTDSMNASTTLAVLAFETVRQRQNPDNR